MARQQKNTMNVDPLVEKVFRFYAEHLSRHLALMSPSENKKSQEAFIDDFLSSGETVPPPGIEMGMNETLYEQMKIFLDMTSTYYEILSFQHRFDTLCRIGQKYEKSINIKTAATLFLEELYIFRERIKLYSNSLKKGSEKEKGEKISQNCALIMKLYDRNFNPLIRKRNKHVHCTRYEDAQIRRLSNIELMIKLGKFDLLEKSHKEKFTEIKEEWRELIHDSGKLSTSLMNKYLTILLPYIMTGEETQDALDP